MFWLSVPCLMYSWQIFPPTLWVVSSVYRLFLLLCRSFLILWSPICPSFLLVAGLLGFCWGSICLSICSRVFPAPCYSNFRISGLIFKSLIHFKLILVQVIDMDLVSVQKVDNHFPQQHLLSRLSFLHHIFLAPLSKMRWV
jgi:hypothetical protein